MQFQVQYGITLYNLLKGGKANILKYQESFKEISKEFISLKKVEMGFKRDFFKEHSIF